MAEPGLWIRQREIYREFELDIALFHLPCLDPAMFPCLSFLWWPAKVVLLWWKEACRYSYGVLPKLLFGQGQESKGTAREGEGRVYVLLGQSGDGVAKRPGYSILDLEGASPPSLPDLEVVAYPTLL